MDYCFSREVNYINICKEDLVKEIKEAHEIHHQEMFKVGQVSLKYRSLEDLMGEIQIISTTDGKGQATKGSERSRSVTAF